MVVLSFLCAFFFCMFSSEASISVPAPSCPEGQIWVTCVPCAWDCNDRHLLASCTAVCPNPGCACPSETFWDGKRCVPSDHCPPSSITCPPGIEPRPCLVAPCSTKVCQRFPLAACVDNYCCDCEANFYWEGRKLSKEECDCPGNQIFQECGSACPAICSNRDDSIFCPAVCIRGCGCPLGTVLSEVSQFCIPANLCPKQCPKGQVYHEFKPCGRDCKYVGKPVRCPEIWQSGCACPDGYVWSELIEECVPINKCPTKCKGKQVFVKCKSPQSTCRDLARPPPFCDVPCKPGCDCPPGFVYSEIVGDCVPNNWCPSGCPNNQIYHKCKPCTQTCKTIHRPVPCLTICLSGCGCPKNMVLNEATGECVTADQCPGPPTCPGNQVWHPCKPCAWKCSNRHQAPLCRPGCPNPGCACVFGTFWDGEECVPPDSCPPKPVPAPSCPEGQIWVTCVPCAWDCSDRHLLASCTAVCPNPGCACPSETFWDGKRCVPSDHCPPSSITCPPGIEPSPCVVAPCSTKVCQRFPLAACVDNYCCDCEANFYWEGRKLSKEECDCPGNQIFQECGSACPATCSNRDDSILCAAVCIRGCGCPPGTVLSEKSQLCVPARLCPKQCPNGQVYHECKPCGRDCKYVGKSVLCPEICQPGCACPDGYVWSELIGECVPINKCPTKCKGKQVFVKCKSPQSTCRDLAQPPPFCDVPCKPGCGCPPGFVYSIIVGDCVPNNWCPSGCPNNQIYHKCKPCTQTCKTIHRPVPCLTICLSGCGCPKNTVLNEATGECVTADQCPGPPTCPGNQVWHPCKPCAWKCSNRHQAPLCRPGCPNPGCACVFGTFWDGEECVPPDSCPPKPDCPSNKVYHKCLPCQQTCKGPPLLCSAKCKPGCGCAKGYKWSAVLKKCVLPKACPQDCPSNKVYHKCLPCQQTCKGPRKFCRLPCKPGCGCAEGYKWSALLKKCVLSRNCPKDCPGNQVFYPRCKPCLSTCKDVGKPKPCLTVCLAGCSCPHGKYWSVKLKRCVSSNECPKAPTCPGNQVWLPCKPCAWKCSNKHLAKVCRPGCPNPGCACPFGTFWDGGECVPPDRCPSNHPDPTCPGNQVWRSCVPCAWKCSDKDLLPLCFPRCPNPGCACASGTFWNGEECVPPGRCPSKPDCPGNQVFYPRCKPCLSTCKDVGKPKVCPAICASGCSCPRGKYWSVKLKRCVSSNECPKDCPSNKVYHKCLPCQQTCKGPPRLCTLECKPGCGCAEGYKWSALLKKCVLSKNCPKDCPGNQVFYPRCKPCLSTCKDVGKPKPCLTVCLAGCSCPRGKYWSVKLKRCVSSNECPKDCPSNKVYHKCLPCQQTCKGPLRLCTSECKPGCGCAKGYKWSAVLKKCVLPKTCPKDCPGNQVFYPRCKPCLSTCKDVGKLRPCPAICASGCSCPRGKYWSVKLKRCVSSNECPKDCPGNQLYYSRCKPCLRTCDQVGASCTKNCLPAGCSCPAGKYWNKFTTKCVAADDCPTKKCPKNQIYKKCVWCVPKCPTLFARYCARPAKCSAKCTCSSGLYLNAGGYCVARYRCPSVFG